MNKNSILIIVLSVLSWTALCQSTNKKVDNNLDSIDKIISTLYAVIFGEKGEARDWTLFKSLFHPDAKLIFTQKNKEGRFMAKYITPDEI